MKKVLLALLLVALLAIPALADDTGRGQYTTPISGLTDFLNENDCFYHVHDYKRGIDNPYGLGLDIKVFDFKKLNEQKDNKVLGFLDAINIENKYDFNNSNYSVFVVMSVDLTSLWQK